MVKLSLLEKFKKPSFKKDKKSQTAPAQKKKRKGFPKPSLPKNIVVFESSGAGLSGAIIGCTTTSELTVRGSALSTAVSPTEAIAEIVTLFKEQGIKRLPKKAVIITPCAAGNLLYLPVDPKKKMARAQMSEMVRWELEELFVEQNDLWSTGGLLQARGHLSQEERQHCEKEAEAQGLRLGSNIYNDYVNSEQLGECLGLQEQFLAEEDEIITGWSCHAAADEMESYSWMGIGISESVRKSLVEACRKNGFIPTWVYPRSGSPAALIEGVLSWVLLDIGQEQMTLFSGEDERIKSLSRSLCRHGLATEESVTEKLRSVLHQDIKTVYIAWNHPQASALQEALARTIGQEVILLKGIAGHPETEGFHPVTPTVEGAARHALGLCKKHILARIEAEPPGPPLWKNKQLYPWAALVVLLAAIGGVETYMNKSAAKNEWALELAEIEYQKKMEIKKQAAATVAEVKQLEKELTGKEAELEEQKRLREILDSVIKKRQDLVPGMIEALGRSINNLVVLKSLEEYEDRSGFFLVGWALKDTEGQIFTKRLNEELRFWNYKLGEISLQRGKNSDDIDGFVIKLNMVKVKTAGGANG